MTFKKHESGRTLADLQKLQQMPLQQKVIMTKARIRQWVTVWGLDHVYVSFSGGKDSTVLLHIAREMYPDIKAVFINTGLEFPEIVQFVKMRGGCEIIYPSKGFWQVVCDYGYPIISKEISQDVYEARGQAKANGIGVKETTLFKRKFDPNSEYCKKYKAYCCERYTWLFDAPFGISHKCCSIMKKGPAHKYTKETGRKPITAQMASESAIRATDWLTHGCNGFDKRNPMSNPMSFWFEQDILAYIKLNNIEIASPYGEIKAVYRDGITQVDGQMNIADFPELGVFDCEIPQFETTGCGRTGCIACGFGIHLDKPSCNRLYQIERLSNPKMLDWILRGGAFNEDGEWKPDNRGLGFWFVYEWVNRNGNLRNTLEFPYRQEYIKKYSTPETDVYLKERKKFITTK